MDTETLDRHLTLIYEAATHPETWPDVLADIARTVNARSGHMAIDNVDCDVPVPLSLIHHGFDPDALEAYFAHYHTCDVWTAAMNRPQLNSFVASDAYVPQQDYLRTEFHADWGRPYDVVYATGTYLARDDGLGLRIAFQRGARQGRFKTETLAYLNRLRKHMLRAVSLADQLSAASLTRRVELSDVESRSLAVFVVDAVRRCMHLNPAARALVAAQPWIALRRDLLSIVCADLDRQVANAVRSMTGPILLDADEPCTLSIDHDGTQWLIEVSPLRGAPTLTPSGSLSAMAVIMVRPLAGDPNTAARRLRVLYGLTATEVDVALSLADGHSPDWIASERVRSLHTIRTQIRAVLAKTGLSSVAALVARVNQLSA